MVRSWTALSALIGLCLVVALQAEQGEKQAPPAAPTAETKQTALPLSSLTEFSATMVGSVLGNIDELKVYRSGDLMRTEMLDGNYMVTDLVKRDTWIVLPDRCAYDPRPSVNTFPFSVFRPGQDVKRNLVGTEEVDGHVCHVEEVTVTSPHGASMKLKMWEATDLSGFPIKIEIYRTTGQPATITYKNVTIGRPDPSVFKHPATCNAPPKAKNSAGKPAGQSAPSKKP
jgi:outer membrane lipoprotein-sorting protein